MYVLFVIHMNFAGPTTRDDLLNKIRTGIFYKIICIRGTWAIIVVI